MRVLVIGATGGTGRELVLQALEQGHTVTAFVRNPQRMPIRHEQLILIEGNILDEDSVNRAVQGQDAVLCALGHKRWLIPTRILSLGTRNLVDAMKKHGVGRLVCETSLGVGDSIGKLGLYYTLFVIPFIVFFYFLDKGRQERIIRQSGLDWIIVRPARLTTGKKRGTYRHGSKVGNYLLTQSVSRADTAEFMLRQLTSNDYLHLSPGIAY